MNVSALIEYLTIPTFNEVFAKPRHAKRNFDWFSIDVGLVAAQNSKGRILGIFVPNVNEVLVSL